jgi:hypothetical protein
VVFVGVNLFVAILNDHHMTLRAKVAETANQARKRTGMHAERAAPFLHAIPRTVAALCRLAFRLQARTKGKPIGEWAAIKQRALAWVLKLILGDRRRWGRAYVRHARSRGVWHGFCAYSLPAWLRPLQRRHDDHKRRKVDQRRRVQSLLGVCACAAPHSRRALCAAHRSACECMLHAAGLGRGGGV